MLAILSVQQVTAIALMRAGSLGSVQNAWRIEMRVRPRPHVQDYKRPAQHRYTLTHAPTVQHFGRHEQEARLGCPYDVNEGGKTTAI